MKFTFHASPNLRQKQSTQQIMLELMIGLLVVFAFSLIYYNQAYSFDHMLQAIKLLAVSLLVAFVTELAWAFFMKKDQKFDLPYIRKFMGGSFGWITAIILTLMCPISIRPVSYTHLRLWSIWVLFCCGQVPCLSRHSLCSGCIKQPQIDSLT